jgi:WD40 repeat protein/serine/threonine protein kinase
MNEREIFIGALQEKDPAEQQAYLDRACGTDTVLRRRVEGLLRDRERAANFLDAPVLASVATLDELIKERPGTVIGPYKLLQQIGEGGMGVVYMAEQQQPVRRKVALKIVKPGMDSAQVIARFEAERQALALMDHQNIAKVLDAGTTDNRRPYFVMELVHGVPITQYCDDNHLTPRARLELFLPVCHAVQHAHQKGIIHRDLKPSNVLVCLYDGVAVPKVIDFGIAKATGQQLTERTMFTQFGSLVGTLEYMSPEQAEMSQLGIDTRSDVYSLGVMLYELLTGTTPLERQRVKEAGFDEIRRLIREEEPPKPSTRLSKSGVELAAISVQRQTEPGKLTRLVRGELDWIVMKSLEKDRNRRYETANGLAKDVERYLHDEPVEACPPTPGYRLRKFARKHKMGLATAVGFAVLLALGTVVSAWQAVRATQAESAALVHEQQANENAVQAQEKEQEANQQRDEARRRRDEVQALNAKLQASQDELRSTLYAAHMNLAQHAWEAGGVERVRELLELHRLKPGETDLHGFEWNYLYRLCRPNLLTLKGHTSFIDSVAYSPDGKRLASCSDEEIKVWDAQTGQELLTCKGHTGNLWRVAYSPDGKRLASASADQTVKVWDAQTGQELLTLKGHTGAATSVAYSPDGKRLASAGGRDGTVKVWDAQTGQELLTCKGHTFIESVAYSPDGKRLASGAWNETTKKPAVKVWDAQTGQELLSLQGHTHGMNCVIFSPDGKRLASASYDRTVKVWDAQTGQELLSLKGHSNAVESVAYSRDGKRLASADDDKIVKVWDAQTGQELLTFRGVGRCAVFSPDGKRLASGSKVWDAQEDQEKLTLEGDAEQGVAFSPDGRRLASASHDSTVKIWDAQTGQRTLTLKGHTGLVLSVAFSPDGKRLASGGGGHRNPRGGWGISRGDRAEVKVWDALTGGELLSLRGLNGWTCGVAYSPDGKRLATVSGGPGTSPEVKVWDALTGHELLTLTLKGYRGLHGLTRIAYSPDGKHLASASGDDAVKVWDAQTGQELLTIKGARGSVSFSPDGKRLASDGKVWDAQTGQELLSLQGGAAKLVFSPDGKRLAGASWGHTVKVWDAQTGQELLTFKLYTNPMSVGFSPDGNRLASAGDPTVTIWDATPLPEKP